MEAEEDVAVETTTMRRHDSLKAKKRTVLATLAQKRLQSAQETTADSRSVISLLKCILKFLLIFINIFCCRKIEYYQSGMPVRNILFNFQCIFLSVIHFGSGS